MQEALTATEKFNKVSTNDWDTSIWPLWDLWVDGAWEIWTSRSSEATRQLVPKRRPLLLLTSAVFTSAVPCFRNTVPNIYMANSRHC